MEVGVAEVLVGIDIELVVDSVVKEVADTDGEMFVEVARKVVVGDGVELVAESVTRVVIVVDVECVPEMVVDANVELVVDSDVEEVGFVVELFL